MNDFILKLKMLRLYRFYLRDWYINVWTQDADMPVCCSGYECGCYGADYGDMWKSMLGK